MADGIRVIVGALGRVASSQLAPFLRRDAFSVLWMQSLPVAIAKAVREKVKLVLGGCVVPADELEALVKALRAPSSASRKCGFALVCESKPPKELMSLVGRGVNRVLWVGMGTREVVAKVAELLNVSTRLHSRVVVRFKTIYHIGATCIAQTENISATGALIRSSERPAVGTPLSIEIYLPKDPVPLRIGAQVVRHTNPDREGIVGFGVKFVSMDVGSKAKLTQFLEKALKDVRKNGV